MRPNDFHVEYNKEKGRIEFTFYHYRPDKKSAFYITDAVIDDRVRLSEEITKIMRLSIPEPLSEAEQFIEDHCI